MNLDHFRCRLDTESAATVRYVFYSFVCMLTDEQLTKWHQNCVTTIRALNNSVDRDTEQTQQFIREEQLKKDIIESICDTRNLKLAHHN